MNLDRMVFEPGDKVMRVGGNRPGARLFKYHGKAPSFGRVYRVEDFWEGPHYNVVMLVGFGGWRYSGEMKIGWYAGAFRKVEEIQLCVKAAQQMKQKELETV